LEFEDDETSSFDVGATLNGARTELYRAVRAATEAGRLVHEADIYEGDEHRMNVPVAFLVSNGDWDNWCGNPPKGLRMPADAE
jgi:hypothetical protein